MMGEGTTQATACPGGGGVGDNLMVNSTQVETEYLMLTGNPIELYIFQVNSPACGESWLCGTFLPDYYPVSAYFPIKLYIFFSQFTKAILFSNQLIP